MTINMTEGMPRRTSARVLARRFVLSLSLSLALLLGCDAAVAGEGGEGAWMDAAMPPADRAAKLAAAMTSQERLVLLHGASGYGIGNTAAIPRAAVRVPALHLEDGPSGVADWQVNVTNWPSSMTMAASWDTELMQQYGAAMGSEQRGKGMQVMLGPGVNLVRARSDTPQSTPQSTR